MAFQKPNDASLQTCVEDAPGASSRRSTRQAHQSAGSVHAALLSPPFGMKAAVASPCSPPQALIAASRTRSLSTSTGPSSRCYLPSCPSGWCAIPSTSTSSTSPTPAAGASRWSRRWPTISGSPPAGPRSRRQRVANVLAVASGLVSRISLLDNYSRHTRNVAPDTLAVREALTVAVEPDELLFAALPEALGFDPVSAGDEDCEHASDFALAVATAMIELDSCLDRLLAELLELLLDTCGANSRMSVMGEAAALGDEVLDPEVRAFVLALANDGTGSDADWIAAVATVVARKAPAEWTDRRPPALPPRAAREAGRLPPVWSRYTPSGAPTGAGRSNGAQGDRHPLRRQRVHPHGRNRREKPARPGGRSGPDPRRVGARCRLGSAGGAEPPGPAERAPTPGCRVKRTR